MFCQNKKSAHFSANLQTGGGLMLFNVYAPWKWDLSGLQFMGTI